MQDLQLTEDRASWRAGPVGPGSHGGNAVTNRPGDVHETRGAGRPEPVMAVGRLRAEHKSGREPQPMDSGHAWCRSQGRDPDVLWPKWITGSLDSFRAGSTLAGHLTSLSEPRQDNLCTEEDPDPEDQEAISYLAKAASS